MGSKPLRKTYAGSVEASCIDWDLQGVLSILRGEEVNYEEPLARLGYSDIERGRVLDHIILSSVVPSMKEKIRRLLYAASLKITTPEMISDMLNEVDKLQVEIERLNWVESTDRLGEDVREGI